MNRILVLAIEHGCIELIDTRNKRAILVHNTTELNFRRKEYFDLFQGDVVVTEPIYDLLRSQGAPQRCVESVVSYYFKQEIFHRDTTTMN